MSYKTKSKITQGFMALFILLICVSCETFAIQPPAPTIQGRVLSCEPPTTREDGQPINTSEMVFEFTYGLLSDTGDGEELHTTLGSDCYMILPILDPGVYHAFVLVRLEDGTGSQPTESEPFTVKASPNIAENLKVN